LAPPIPLVVLLVAVLAVAVLLAPPMPLLVAVLVAPPVPVLVAVPPIGRPAPPQAHPPAKTSAKPTPTTR
jgi:hypothetical protein